MITNDDIRNADSREEQDALCIEAHGCTMAVAVTRSETKLTQSDMLPVEAPEGIA